VIFPETGVCLRLLSFALIALNCGAQSSEVIGRRITAIEYLPGQLLHPADLTRVQPLKTGSVLRAEDVGNAIDGLFATGRFEDITAEAEPSGDGVILRFVTTPARFVGGVSVEGKIKQPPNRGELTSSSRMQLGDHFYDEDVATAVKRMNQVLTANGLYEAQVTPDIRETGVAGEVFITFQVRSGKRAKYTTPVIQGETKLSHSTIVRATGWRLPIIHWWRQVTDARTRGGVQGVLGKYQKQQRLTASVELEKLDYDAARNRVVPRLNIDPGPRIRIEAVEAEVSKRVMKRYVPVYQEQAVDNDLLVEGARNLRDYFQSKGYYDVDVDFRIRPPSEDEQLIEYVIAQGQRYKLVHLAITGRTYFTEEDLRERMFMQTAGFLRGRGRYSEAFRKKDEENIANLYKANGFRDVKVTSIVDRNFGGKTGEVGVTVNIEEGPQWLVENITVTGIDQGDREALVQGLASIAGQPFSEVNMAADRNYILTWYYSNGYPKADLRAAWHRAGTPNRANVFFTVTEGERQYVRDVLTSGFKTTRPDLVKRRITIEPGDPLSPLMQSEIQRRFYDMGVFARVDTAIQNAEGDTSYKYILYNFEEANRYTLSLGFGAQIARIGSPSSTSLSAPAGSTGFAPQGSVNLSRLNFLGRGHTVSLRGIYSNLQKRASLSYLAPRFQDVDGRNVTVSVLWDDSFDVRTFASRRQEASIQLSQRFSKATTGLARLTYRRVSVSDIVIPVLLVPQLIQPVRLGMISGNIVQDRRDDSGDPHRGMFNTADVGVAARFLGSERSFTRLLVRNATYHRVTRNSVLARQTQFGWIAPFSAPPDLSEAQSIPLPERFFGGGADSLRAFPYNQAGPRDTGEPLVPGGPSSQPTGFPLGGNALLFNNVELRFPLLGANIQGVLFHDMGNVYSTISDVSFRFRQRDLNDFNYMVHAVGFGLRYRTPVGPVRVDLAYSVNPPEFLGFSGTAQEILQCDPNKLPLPSFCESTRQRVSRFQFFFSIGQTF
jgi:outer membrane protein assembly complex protein YaeT